MIRRPPRSTLFPYTDALPIFPADCRRGNRGGAAHRRVPEQHQDAAARDDAADHPALQRRSEEHTSELQSPCNLVCRLLLEKKKEQEAATGSLCRTKHHAPQPT